MAESASPVNIVNGWMGVLKKNLKYRDLTKNGKINNASLSSLVFRKWPRPLYSGCDLKLWVLVFVVTTFSTL
jgi:hypothetical protein